VSERKPKPRKEAFFVQVESADKIPYFANVSAELGRPLRFSKPMATCALRVTDDAVVFSMLRLHTRTRAALTSGPLAMPPGPLARLERRLAALETRPGDGQILIEYDNVVYPFTFERDANGVLSLEQVGDETVFELPRTPLQMAIFLPGPRGRTIVAGWVGYQSKPGGPETLTRSLGHALNHLSGLPEFSALTGITAVKVPAPPGRMTLARPARKPSDEVTFAVEVKLWTDSATPTPVAAGVVNVHVDLDTPAPWSGRLLLNYTPSAEIAEHFETYRGVLDSAVQSILSSQLPQDEVDNILQDIVLGEVGPGTVERLRDAAAAVPAFNLNPRQFAAAPAA